MKPAPFLTATAAVEIAAGGLFLARPALPLELLLGGEPPSPESSFVGRVAGAALLAIGVGCWVGRGDGRSAGRLGLVTGALIYDALVAVLLAYAGTAFRPPGVALWPGVALHTALAVWGVLCLRTEPGGGANAARGD